MKTLSIDPGFERLGIAIVEKNRGKKEVVLYSSCFKTSAQLSFPERLLLIGSAVEEVIKKYTPDALAIEKLFFTTNQKTAMRVAEVRGVIIFISQKHHLSIHEYTPLQIKTAITGYGKANKEQMMAMIPRLVDLQNKDKRTDDEFDAIATGLTHCAYSMVVEK